MVLTWCSGAAAGVCGGSRRRLFFAAGSEVPSSMLARTAVDQLREYRCLPMRDVGSRPRGGAAARVAPPTAVPDRRARGRRVTQSALAIVSFPGRLSLLAPCSGIITYFLFFIFLASFLLSFVCVFLEAFATTIWCTSVCVFESVSGGHEDSLWQREKQFVYCDAQLGATRETVSETGGKIL